MYQKLVFLAFYMFLCKKWSAHIVNSNKKGICHCADPFRLTTYATFRVACRLESHNSEKYQPHFVIETNLYLMRVHKFLRWWLQREKLLISIQKGYYPFRQLHCIQWLSKLQENFCRKPSGHIPKKRTIPNSLISRHAAFSSRHFKKL